jgi:hypothetical protein
MASRRSRQRHDKRQMAEEVARTDDEHVPATGPMSIIPWGETTAYQFCSCGTWHLNKLADEAAEKVRDSLAKKP